MEEQATQIVLFSAVLGCVLGSLLKLQLLALVYYGESMQYSIL